MMEPRRYAWKTRLPISLLSFVLMASIILASIPAHASQPPPLNDGAVADFNPIYNGGGASCDATSSSTAGSIALKATVQIQERVKLISLANGGGAAGTSFARVQLRLSTNSHATYFDILLQSDGSLTLDYPNHSGTGQNTAVLTGAITSFIGDGLYHNYTLSMNTNLGTITGQIDGTTQSSQSDAFYTGGVGPYGFTYGNAGLGPAGTLDVRADATTSTATTDVRFDEVFTAVNGASNGADVFTPTLSANLASEPADWTNTNAHCTETFGLADGSAVAQTTSTVTTTINTGCLGACSGGNNGTQTVFTLGVPHIFIYDFSVNIQGASQIDNVTVKVGAVHIATKTGTVYVLGYEPATPTNPASAGNLWTLASKTPVTVQNGTTAFFIHVNPQMNVCASCYYAVGIMSNTNKSNSATVGGSGVSFYLTSQKGIQQQSFTPASTTPPTTFFSSTVSSPTLFLYIHNTFPVVTVTSTSTSTLSGTVSTTVTSTSTVTTIDASFFNQNSNWPIIFFILFLPTFLMIAATRSVIGGLFGFILGAIIGLFMSIIPAYVFTGIVIVVVAFGYLANKAGVGGD